MPCYQENFNFYIFGYTFYLGNVYQNLSINRGLHSEIHEEEGSLVFSTQLIVKTSNVFSCLEKNAFFMNCSLM